MGEFLQLKSVDEILAILASFPPLPTETIPLAETLGRALADDLLSPLDLPGFNRSSMDGYAVRARDVFGASEGLPALLRLVGDCPMGETPAFSLGPSETARIWTGGMLPEGADAVVMLEYARETGRGEVELTRPAAPGENIIEAAEDARQGERLLPAGRKLRPEDLGLLAALGLAEISVRRRPRVAVISSGDEVVPLTATPRPGQVRDINTYTLCALAQTAGGVPRALGIAGDSPEQLRRLLLEALEWADVILLSGGSSAGQRDYTVAAFAEIPGTEILAHGVAISPGKPLILARRDNVSLWGLPGHAASALVTAEVLVRPLLERLSGQAAKEVWRRGCRAVLTRPVASAQGRRDFIRVRLEAREDAEVPLAATPVLGKSGLITTLVLADGLVVCPEDREGLYAGQVVEVLLGDEL